MLAAMMEAGEDLNWLERAGLRVLTQASDAWPEPSDPIDVLTLEEQRQLRRITLRAVLSAGLAGALSALGSALATFLGPDPERQPVQHWSCVIGVTLVASGLEFAFLYWDGLRAVRAMAKAAGLRVNSGTQLDRDVAVALARAALELPSPPKNRLGVDPHREASRFQLLLASLVYKGKVALTNVVLKALLRRLLGPAATRAWLVWVAVPVTGVWNAIVAYELLWQARIRVMGPSAARDLAGWVRRDAPATSLVLPAIGASIVANQEAHPNVLAFAQHFEADSELQLELGDVHGFLQKLSAASELEREQALRATLATAILDGRITGRERRWLDRVFAAAGIRFQPKCVRDLRRCFVQGRGVAGVVSELTLLGASSKRDGFLGAVGQHGVQRR